MFCFVKRKQRLTIHWAVQSTETGAYSCVSEGQMVRSPAQTMVSGKVRPSVQVFVFTWINLMDSTLDILGLHQALMYGAWCLVFPDFADVITCLFCDDSILQTRWTKSILLLCDIKRSQTVSYLVLSDVAFHRRKLAWNCLAVQHHKHSIISAASSSEYLFNLIQMNVHTIDMSGRNVGITCCDVLTCATFVRGRWRLKGLE